MRQLRNPKRRKRAFKQHRALTSLLLDYVEMGALQSMKPEHVNHFLVRNLKWRIITVGKLCSYLPSHFTDYVIQVDGKQVNPRRLVEHSFKLSISCKVAPLPGEQSEVIYERYPGVTQQIIDNSTPPVGQS
jgi:hypothetical protein